MSDIFISYIEPWTEKYHGYDGSGFKPSGHFISILDDVNLNEFYNIEKDKFIISQYNRNIKLEITKKYNIGEYTLCYPVTHRIRLIQKYFRKKVRNKKKYLVKIRELDFN